MPDPRKSQLSPLDGQMLLRVLAQVKAGDFTARMPLEWTGVAGKVADDLNTVIMANEALEKELARVSRVVGRQGELSQRAALGGWAQNWSGGLESVNTLIEALVRPTSEMQRVIGAVADGDLSKKVSVEVSGEMLELKTTINAMVDQLNGFVSEVSRVAREVGTEGKLGQAAAFTTEVGGVWKDLTDNVNLMAGNLTGQVRNIAEVTTAVANGDLSKKITIDVQGEFLELKNTVNAMVDQLKTFSGEVTRVAREVGVEGRLGGQAQTAEVGGVWKDLTGNVNQLAANLTNQVRAIAEVATAVTEGDLTRQVRVEASGEVAALKDKLNEMIRNLRETTEQNVEQDWLKTNRERFTRMLQGQDDLTDVSSMILSELAPLVSAQHGVLYTLSGTSDDGPDTVLEMRAGYGCDGPARTFRLGEGLVGQCAKERKRILLTDVPEDYVRIGSGLGEASPSSIIVLPVLFEGTVRAVVELASFSPFSLAHQAFLDSITESIGVVLNTIQAAGLTEMLLQQSRSQAEELQAQQEELRGTNADLARQASLLAEQNVVAEQKNLEVEESKRLIEEKVHQLAVSSRYKSEFIANMSHELRTPLNSLLILAQQLEDNTEGNLSDTQVEYANVIYSSGKELLELLNSILDLARVESGTVVAERDEVGTEELRTALLREFAPVAHQKGLDYAIDVLPGVPQSIITDHQRLRQILKNLLSNAFKFTERGGVQVTIGLVDDREHGGRRRPAVSFAVTDTGIGIDEEQQKRIFEAFAQGNGGTSRLYGGTGLGLSISRELVGLLQGTIGVRSESGNGSTFTVCLPTEPTLLAVSSSAPPLHAYAVPDELRGQTAHTLPTPPPDVGGPRAAADPPSTPDHRATPSPGSDRSLKGMKILVVDDKPRNLFAMKTLLQRADAEVETADGGAEALKVLERIPDIDIVLMDIMMPRMDGYAAIQAIRRDPRNRDLTIIAVTAKVMAGERKRCLDAGATDYVPKPVNQIELLTALRRWLPRTSETNVETVPALSLVGPAGNRFTPRLPAAMEPGRLEGLSFLVVDDDYANVFAMTAILERGGAVVTVAESGAEALAALERTPHIDVVLMDIMMPRMDGYDTIRSIRRRQGFEALPIVAVTGKAPAGEHQRCIDAGADDYISKPVDTRVLLTALGPWLPAEQPQVN